MLPAKYRSLGERGPKGEMLCKRRAKLLLTRANRTSVIYCSSSSSSSCSCCSADLGPGWLLAGRASRRPKSGKPKTESQTPNVETNAECRKSKSQCRNPQAECRNPNFENREPKARLPKTERLACRLSGWLVAWLARQSGLLPGWRLFRHF